MGMLLEGSMSRYSSYVLKLHAHACAAAQQIQHVMEQAFTTASVPASSDLHLQAHVIVDQGYSRSSWIQNSFRVVDISHHIFRDHVTHFLHFIRAELDFQGTNILLHALDPLCS